MTTFLLACQWIAAHFQQIIAASVSLLTGIIAVCLLIPGDSPEKQLQVVVDFLKKYSAK